jgi:hypothetical protein
MKTLHQIHTELCSKLGCPGTECEFLRAIESAEFEVSELRKQVEAENKALRKERDRLKTEKAHMQADAEQAVFSLQQQVSDVEKRVHDKCAVRIGGTYAYLADGTIATIKRNPDVKGRVWLEVNPQKIIRTQAKSGIED